MQKIWKECIHICIYMHACLVTSVMSDSLVTPWTVALRAPLSMGFYKQEYWSGLPCPLLVYIYGFPGDLDGKESACNAGDLSLTPGWGRSPGEENGYIYKSYTHTHTHIHTHTHTWITLLYIWNLYYIVNQLYFKGKKSHLAWSLILSVSTTHCLLDALAWSLGPPYLHWRPTVTLPPVLPLSPPSSFAFAHSSHFLDSALLYVCSLTKAPRWSRGKESTCQCRRCRFDPWDWKIPGVGNGNPFQCSCLENSMDKEAWQAIVHVSDTTEQLITNLMITYLDSQNIISNLYSWLPPWHFFWMSNRHLKIYMFKMKLIFSPAPKSTLFTASSMWTETWFCALLFL